MIGPLGPFEVGILGVVALLLFGKRLPEVARAMGRSIVEFKEGLRSWNSSPEQDIENKKPNSPLVTRSKIKKRGAR